MNDDIRRFYGKYRGVVTDTVDPSSLGRIKVTLEDFAGSKDNWSMGTAVITMAIDDGITIEFPDAKVTLTASSTKAAFGETT